MSAKSVLDVCITLGLLSLAGSAAAQTPAEFGYAESTFIAEHGNTRYYRKPSISPEYIDVVAVHTGLGDDEYVLDLDPLLTRSQRGDYVLSYLLMPAEIDAFNEILGAELRAADPAATIAQVFHHIVGKSAGKRYSPWTRKSTESAVFAHAYDWIAEQNDWRPSYEQPTNKNRSGIGRFSTRGTRYSVNSTRAYVDYLNKKEDSPSLRFTDVPVDELNMALKSGSEAVRERHKKYALWSDGYWAYYKIPMALDVINGNFDRVEINRDFRYLFVNFLRAYSESCQDNMKNPQELTYVLTEREIDAYGFTVSEDVTSVSVVLETEYLETYDAYWNNGQDRAAVMTAVFKSFSRNNKRPGYTPELFRSMDYLEAGRTMLRVDTCDEPAPQRLLANLLRRAKGDSPIRSGLSLVAHER